MKKIATVLILFSLCLGIRGQTISLDVLCPGSTNYVGSGFTWDGTFGDVFTETIGGSIIFTQGFHQPYTTVFGVDERYASLQLNVYPNPVASNLNVYIDGLNSIDQIEMLVSDLGGRVLIHRNLNSGANQVDLTGLSGGMYLLTLSDGKNRIAASKISKM